MSMREGLMWNVNRTNWNRIKQLSRTNLLPIVLHRPIEKQIWGACSCRAATNFPMAFGTGPDCRTSSKESLVTRLPPFPRRYLVRPQQISWIGRFFTEVNARKFKFESLRVLDFIFPILLEKSILVDVEVYQRR